MDNIISFLQGNSNNLLILSGFLIFIFFSVKYQISKNMSNTLDLMRQEADSQKNLKEMEVEKVEKLEDKIEKLNNHIYDLQKLIENQDLKIENLYRRIKDLEDANSLKSMEVLHREKRIGELINILEEIKVSCPAECQYSTIMLKNINKAIRGDQ